MTNAARSQWIAVGVIVTVLAGALTAGILLTDDVMRVEVGSDAPSFTAVDLATGDAVTLADYEGEVVLLNLWATWCAPCRVEMPSLERLHEELGPEGLHVVAVSVDGGGSQTIEEFVDELGLTFDVLHDRTQEIELDYQTTGLPETYIIDRRGVIVHWRIGPDEWDSPANVARLRRFLESEE